MVAAPSASSAAAGPSATPAASVAIPKPVPSLVVGREACELCLAAVTAGQFLTPEGSSHYLAGCDIPALRQRCVDATRRALPLRARELVARGRCDDARVLAEFGERGGASSRALQDAVASCRGR